MSTTKRRLIVIVAAVLFVAMLVTTPDLSHPPDWLNRQAIHITMHSFPILLWLGGIALLAIWFVLLWQRSIPETSAATWNRRLSLAWSILLLMLAVGRTFGRAWLAVGFAAGILGIIGTSFAMLLAIGQTYLYPVWVCRDGRCEVVPPSSGGVVPVPPVDPWDGVSERRTGPAERRKKRPPSGMTPA